MLFNSIKVIMKNPGEGRATSRLDQETLITKMIILHLTRRRCSCRGVTQYLLLCPGLIGSQESGVDRVR